MNPQIQIMWVEKQTGYVFRAFHVVNEFVFLSTQRTHYLGGFTAAMVSEQRRVIPIHSTPDGSMAIKAKSRYGEEIMETRKSLAKKGLIFNILYLTLTTAL